MLFDGLYGPMHDDVYSAYLLSADEALRCLKHRLRSLVFPILRRGRFQQCTFDCMQHIRGPFLFPCMHTRCRPKRPVTWGVVHKHCLNRHEVFRKDIHTFSNAKCSICVDCICASLSCCTRTQETVVSMRLQQSCKRISFAQLSSFYRMDFNAAHKLAALTKTA